MIFDDVVKDIDRGINGLNVGLPFKYKNFSKYIPNIPKGRYILVGAETGVGKTSFVDDTYVYTPLEFIFSDKNILNYKLNILYFSYEISKKEKIAKAICRRLFKKYNIDISPNILLSRGDFKLEDYIKEKVLLEQEYFDKIESCIKIFDIPENPTGIYKHVKEYAKEHYERIQHSEFNIEYIPKDPNLYTIIIIDHIGLVRKERGFNTKENIDKLSEYIIEFRNKYDFTTIVIQQFNRGLESTDRKKEEMLYPQLSDFKDSSNSQADSNLILALFNPHKHKLTSLNGFPVNDKEQIRGLFLLKNRDGESDKATVLDFKGSCGIFKEKQKTNEFL